MLSLKFLLFAASIGTFAGALAIIAYDVYLAAQLRRLLTGGAEATHVQIARNSHAPYDVPAGLIRSANDTLFTSGTLGRFCTMMESLPEAET